jgi:peptidoglycan/xylan/chitin deacetylase (PgdA/CDA1 family)
MSLNLFLTFDIESKRSHNYITCEHVPGVPGLFWIMDELERHGLRGVFFVNIYEHTLYPEGWMQDILRQIHNRGHEVALHCHQNRALKFYRRGLLRYDAEGQTKILRYGVDFIEAATGQRPVSFRAGALRANDETFRALEACNLLIDSSLAYSTAPNNHNAVVKYASINRAMTYGKVLEFPITVLDRGGHLARLDPNVVPDLEASIAAVQQMVAAGCEDAVMIAHSFSFVLCTRDASSAIPGTPVFKKCEQKYAMGQDVHVKSVFTGFLQFLQSSGGMVQHALFSDISRDRGQSSFNGADFVPLVANTGLRPWPTAEDYAKLARKGRKLHHRTSPKRVILHVGTWKTGTKALQKFFTLNRGELERQGIHYPLTPSAPYMEGGNRTYQSRLGTSGDADRRERLKALAREIHASICDTSLISHENICNLPQSELLEFVSCLSGCRFKVVLYLRRQDGYAESLYNQHVKAGVTFPGTFEEHFTRYRERYDYRRMILKLGAVFGAENILVRLYEKEQFYGGTIFADFMHHVFDQEVADVYSLPERDQNARLDHDALEFKRLINGLDAPKEQKLAIGRHLVKYCTSVDPRSKEAFQAHELLSPQQRIELLRTFAEGNAWIANAYLGRTDGKLFLEPWPSLEDPWTPYSGLTAGRAAELAFHIYRSLESEVQEGEAERVKAERGGSEARSGGRTGQRRDPGVGRAVKRFCKRQLRQGRVLVSRLRSGPKPGISG